MKMHNELRLKGKRRIRTKIDQRLVVENEPVVKSFKEQTISTTGQ
jgi:hypothetical protein